MAKLYLTTPFLKVLRADTSRPDVFEEGDKPKYKVRLEATDEQIEAWQAEIKKLIGDHKFTAKKPKIGVSNHEDGTRSIQPASLYKPAIFDMKLNKIQAPAWDEETQKYTNSKDDTRLGAGSIVRANVELNPYDKGVGLRLISLQVKKLVEWESKGNGGAGGFTAGEGYATENEETGGFTKEAETDGGSALDI